MFEYLSQLNKEEESAFDNYDELLKYYGYTKKDRKKEKFENKRVKALIKKYKLEKQVFLQGVTVEPIKKMLECDFCVFENSIC